MPPRSFKTTRLEKITAIGLDAVAAAAAAAAAAADGTDPAAAGLSMLMDVGELGFSSTEASRRLLARGKVAATYMRDWGQKNSDQYLRLVFSNEPTSRLADIRNRFDRSLLQ